MVKNCVFLSRISGDLWGWRQAVKGRKQSGVREAIAKLENDRAGHKPSLDTWHASRHSGRRSLFFFSRGIGSRTKGRDERAVKMTSRLYANRHYIITRPRYVYLSASSILRPIDDCGIIIKSFTALTIRKTVLEIFLN